MLVPSLLVLLLPVVAAVTLTTLVTSATLAISAIPVHHASAPAAVAVSPAIVLENQFRKIRNTQKLKSIPAPGSGDGDVQALGDLIKDPGDPNVTTRNELFEGHCSPIVVIFARGTTEPAYNRLAGNVGNGVGPAFFSELLKLRQATIQGVNNYPADIWGYLSGGSNSGALDMANSVKRASLQCPGSRIVLSGYSQGAQVAHKAAQQIPTELYHFVGAIVLFGDPKNGDPFPGSLNDNVKTFCEPDDLICQGRPIPTDAHRRYEERAPEAAAYVAALM